MAHTVDATAQNPANALRASLDLLEKRAVKPDAATIEAFLLQLDELDSRFAQLEADGMDLRPERVRWENVLRRLDSQPELITRAAAATGGLDRLRSVHPPAASFWWHADEDVASRRRRRLVRACVALVGVAALAAVIYVIVTWVFPPNPEAVAVLEATSAVERAIQNDDWDTAVRAARDAAAQNPANAELAMWAIVLSERAGLPNPEHAQAAADHLFGLDPLRYWLLRGEAALRLDDPQISLDAATQALELEPESPEAHFLMGRAALFANDRENALLHLERAANLAEDVNPQLSVSARMIWADLVQRPVFPTTQAP